MSTKGRRAGDREVKAHFNVLYVCLLGSFQLDTRTDSWVCPSVLQRCFSEQLDLREPGCSCSRRAPCL